MQALLGRSLVSIVRLELGLNMVHKFRSRQLTE